MSLLEELETLLETRQPYANGNAEKCYPLVAELIEQLRSAQQSAQADEVIGCAHRTPRVVGDGLFACDDCGKTLRR